MPLIILMILSMGAVWGSFLNVVILRYGQQSLGGRSACPNCQRQLTASDLIPIISFILLRGRCRTCQYPISVQYPLVELSSGLAALIIFTPLPTTYSQLLAALLQFIIVALLIVLFVIDLRTLLLPDHFTILLTLAVLALLAISFVTAKYQIPNTKYQLLISPFFGASIGAGFLGLLWFLTAGRGLGIGDIKLMIPLGALFGPTHTIILLFVAFVIGGVIASWLLLSQKVTMKTAVPFGPFLAGTAILFILVPSLPLQITSWIIG